MTNNLSNITSLSEFNQTMDELVSSRQKLVSNIINQEVISKATNRTGFISDINKKNLTLHFEIWGDVPISLDNYQKVVDLNDSTINQINDYLNTFATERKLNCLKRKLNKTTLNS